jgi:hypothetical protein
LAIIRDSVEAGHTTGTCQIVGFIGPSTKPSAEKPSPDRPDAPVNAVLAK